MKILIIGQGYIGQRLKDSWEDAVVAEGHINDTEDAAAMLEKYQPEVVVNAAGVRGKPNVDWCETHQTETILGNTKLPIDLALACQNKGVYLLHIGSGCVFYGSSPDPKGWKEDDFANPQAFYSKCKYAADLVLAPLPDIAIARIRMPMDYIPSSGNIINKLAGFEKIIDVENSLTVIEDMIAVFYQLLQKRAAGIFHVTNPGTIKHRGIITLYEEFVGPAKVKEWISEEDLLNKGLVKKKRSTNILQSSNLEKIGINMREVSLAARETMKKYAEILKDRVDFKPTHQVNL